MIIIHQQNESLTNYLLLLKFSICKLSEFYILRIATTTTEMWQDLQLTNQLVSSPEIENLYLIM